MRACNRPAGKAALLAAALLTGGLLALIGQTYQTGADTFELFATWAALILPWVLAIQQGLRIGAVASVIAPYPTLSEISKRAAGAHFTPTLFSERTRRLVRLVQRFA